MSIAYVKEELASSVHYHSRFSRTFGILSFAVWFISLALLIVYYLLWLVEDHDAPSVLLAMPITSTIIGICILFFFITTVLAVVLWTDTLIVRLLLLKRLKREGGRLLYEGDRGVMEPHHVDGWLSLVIPHYPETPEEAFVVRSIRYDYSKK